jgi:hypothetical protein
MRESVEQWRAQYSEQRLHDSLSGLPPPVYVAKNLKALVLNSQLDEEAYKLYSPAIDVGAGEQSFLTCYTASMILSNIIQFKGFCKIGGLGAALT